MSMWMSISRYDIFLYKNKYYDSIVYNVCTTDQNSLDFPK